MKVLHYWLGVGAVCASVLGSAVMMAADDKTKAPGKGQDHGAQGMPEMDPKLAAHWEACMRAGTPGDQHKLLSARAGKWNHTVKMWMSPDMAEPMTSDGKTVNEMVFGGRFLKQHTTGDMDGQPFEGLGYVGYDNVQKKFVNTWIDSMGTGIMTGEGTLSPDGKVLTMNSQYPDPVTGKMAKMRSIEKMVDKDSLVMEFYGPDPVSGKEYKMMEITYKRAM
jgi:hypothetical protein